MNRLIEKTVFSGFVMACRLATCPTRISPSFVNPTTEGVRRLPSWFAITVGLPPSTTETTEFVVPRSMPITFGITVCSIPWGRGPYISSSEEPRGPLRDPLLDDVDLDLLGFELFRLRQLDLKNTVAVGCLHAIGLHRHRQLNEPLELAAGAIDVKQILLLDLVLEAALTLDRKQVARDRHTHVLLAHAGKLQGQDEIVLGRVHIYGRRPGPPRHGRGTTEKVVEEAIHFGLDIGYAKRLPPIDGRKPKRTPALPRHLISSFIAFFAGSFLPAILST